MVGEKVWGNGMSTNYVEILAFQPCRLCCIHSYSVRFTQRIWIAYLGPGTVLGVQNTTRENNRRPSPCQPSEEVRR